MNGTVASLKDSHAERQVICDPMVKCNNMHCCRLHIFATDYATTVYYVRAKCEKEGAKVSKNNIG